MITINQSFTIDSGKSPFTYQFSSSSSCVSFTNQQGITPSRTISTDVIFEDTACIASSTITLLVTDSNTPSCTSTLTVDLDNVCDGFTVSSISQSGSYAFTTSAISASCLSHTFDWAYDTSLFIKDINTNTANGSYLKLSLRPGIQPPSSSQIAVTVTNCYGCTETKYHNISICTPVAGNVTVNMYKNGSTYTSAPITMPTPSGCGSLTFDWSTLAAAGISSIFPASITYTNAGAVVTFSAPGTIIPGVFTSNYTVTTNTGLTSTLGTITFVLNAPAPTETIMIPDEVVTLSCSVVAGNTVEINIEDKLVLTSGTTVNWSS